MMASLSVHSAVTIQNICFILSHMYLLKKLNIIKPYTWGNKNCYKKILRLPCTGYTFTVNG